MQAKFLLHFILGLSPMKKSRREGLKICQEVHISLDCADRGAVAAALRRRDRPKYATNFTLMEQVS
ncbi:MAG: hypothetical protein DMF03_06280 [Verrucomicrobia bacterium]|nr:MAG: hypothetical protein DMF03_06280 [Verrucomicrobiota bacterium]